MCRHVGGGMHAKSAPVAVQIPGHHLLHFDFITVAVVQNAFAGLAIPVRALRYDNYATLRSYHYGGFP